MLNKNLETLSEALTSKAISSEEITKPCFQHIATCDPELGAMLWVDEDLALKEAKASDLRRARNEARGALDGVPLSIKDMILCKGLPATAASKILEGYMPCYEATVIEKLRAEGAVILGKANQDEFAMDLPARARLIRSVKIRGTKPIHPADHRVEVPLQ